jgi:hypothetical protein
MKYLMTFLVSMLPIVELRGAVPIGTALGLNLWWVLIISIIGNLIPAPFIILFARPIIRWLKKTKMFAPLANKLEESAYLSAPLPYRVSVSEFEDEYGNGYMMILNRDYEKPMKAELPMKAEFRLYEVSKVDGGQRVIADNTDTLAIELAPGDAVLLRAQDAADEPFTCEYKLAE